jgi:hypothetical protein
MRDRLSFQDALARFKAECDQVVPTAGHLDAADKAHLARLVNDPRVPRLWEKLQSLARSPIGNSEPLEGVIPAMLAARRAAELAQAPSRMIESHRRRCARHLARAQHLDELAGLWRNMADADDPRRPLALERARTYEEEARVWRRLGNRPLPKSLSTITRIDRRGSRKQKTFMKLMSDFLQIFCRKPLDLEVAILNDIAFDTTEATTPYQARSARRSTTVSGRASRQEARESRTQKRHK